MTEHSELRFSLAEVEAAMVAVDVATDLVDEPIAVEDWRQMVLDRLLAMAAHGCALCGAKPAVGWTLKIPPHRTVYLCDACYEHEKENVD